MTGSARRLCGLGPALLLLLATQPARAQAPPILPSTRVVQAGPASLYPAISLRDAGTDSNVYNEGGAGKADFTYAVTPRLYALVPIGAGRFTGTGTGDFVYYRTYKDQQSINAFFEGRYDVVEARFRPFVSAGFATHRERQGLEIDMRARQTQRTLAVGAELELTPITSLTGWVRRNQASWDRGAQYLGVSLADQLDFSTSILAVGARFRLTPLTSIVAVVESQRDRFERSPDRDVDSVRIAPSVEFDNGAVIRGRAQAGYRVFKPFNPTLARYDGFTASAGLGYALLDLTRVVVDLGHDIKYSYDALQPYYLESGVRFKVTQRLAGPLEAIAIGERWRLHHQRLGGESFDGRREEVTTLGGGVGLRVSDQMELTFTVDRTKRTSSEPVGRDYDRRRVLASMSYGL